MRSYVTKLSASDKEALQAVVSHPGMKVFGQWLGNQLVVMPIMSMQDVTHEEVLTLRGKYRAYKEVVSFIEDARTALNNK